MSKQREAFEAIAELHGINIEHPSSNAKDVLGDKCPPYKYQHTNDMFALCHDMWQASRAAALEEAAAICERIDYVLARPDVFADAIRALKEQS